jgi:NAD+ kinase
MQKNVLLLINDKKPEAGNLAKEICKKLESRDYTVEIFSIEHKTERYNSKKTDLCISLGGDGTVLFASRVMAPLDVPVMPVNFGTLGFIAAVSPTQWEKTFNQWEKGKAIISRRLMFDVSVEREDKTIFQSCALNDSVISAAGIAELVKLKLEVEAATGQQIDLVHFRADGLIVATPTGSTGYSVAAGGPIVDPEMDAVIINPVCPFTLANRPIVVHSDERIITLVEKEQRSKIILTVDGQVTLPLECDDRIIVCRSAFSLQLIASDRSTFYRALQTKLEWSGGHSLA